MASTTFRHSTRPSRVAAGASSARSRPGNRSPFAVRQPGLTAFGFRFSVSPHPTFLGPSRRLAALLAARCNPRRARAFLMMGIMISPAFLADEIGYGVQRLFLTADQIAAREVPTGAMPTQ